MKQSQSTSSLDLLALAQHLLLRGNFQSIKKLQLFPPLYPEFTKKCMSIYKTKNIIIEILSGHLDIIKERNSDSVNEPSCGERLVYRSV